MQGNETQRNILPQFIQHNLPVDSAKFHCPDASLIRKRSPGYQEVHSGSLFQALRTQSDVSYRLRLRKPSREDLRPHQGTSKTTLSERRADSENFIASLGQGRVVGRGCGQRINGGGGNSQKASAGKPTRIPARVLGPFHSFHFYLFRSKVSR